MKLLNAFWVGLTVLAAGAIAETASNVKPHDGWHVGGGKVVGTASKSSYKGRPYKTREVVVQVGHLGVATAGFAEARDFSISSAEVYADFQKAETSGLPHIFTYDNHASYYPTWEASHTIITSVKPLYSGNVTEKLPINFVPGQSSWGGKGTYGAGSRRGHIVEVYRNGCGRFFCVTCVIAVRERGLGIHKDTKEVINGVTHKNILSEEACRHAEEVMSYGAQVEVSYHQSHFNLYNDTSYIADRITILGEDAERIEFLKRLKDVLKNDAEIREILRGILTEKDEERVKSQLP